MFFATKRTVLHLVGWMNENHTMHIQSDSLTFGRRHIFSACLGFCFCCLQSFSSCLRLSHRERKVSWLVGAEIRCLCYLSYGLATIVVERARGVFIVGYTTCRGDSGTLGVVFAVSLFRISCHFPFPFFTDSLSLLVLLIMLVSGLDYGKIQALLLLYLILS